MKKGQTATRPARAEWKRLVAASQKLMQAHVCIDPRPTDGDWPCEKDFTCACGAKMRAINRTALASVWTRHLVMEAVAAAEKETLRRCSEWFRARHTRKNNFDGYVKFMLNDLSAKLEPVTDKAAEGAQRPEAHTAT